MNYSPRCTALILDENNTSATPFTYKTSSLFSPRRLTRRSYRFGIENCLHRITMTTSSLTVICRCHSYTSFLREQGLKSNLVRFSRVPFKFSIVSFLTFLIGPLHRLFAHRESGPQTFSVVQFLSCCSAGLGETGIDPPYLAQGSRSPSPFSSSTLL
jgi:hypothetical protein